MNEHEENSPAPPFGHPKFWNEICILFSPLGARHVVQLGWRLGRVKRIIAPLFWQFKLMALIHSIILAHASDFNISSGNYIDAHSELYFTGFSIAQFKRHISKAPFGGLG